MVVDVSWFDWGGGRGWSRERWRRQRRTHNKNSSPSLPPHSTPPGSWATMDAVLKAYDKAAARAASPAARAVVAQLPPDTVARVRKVRAMVSKEFM